MNISYAINFKKRYQKLPLKIQKKVDKQLGLLIINFFHPSLNTKKMSGTEIWEFRIDRSYRMTGEKEKDGLILRTVGVHDAGLGKK